MAKITSNVQLYAEVMRSKRLKVPWHQRYYDWTQEEVIELLEDIKLAHDANNPCYFIGSIMLVGSTGAKSRVINDGQQRLITLSLLMAAFSRQFKREPVKYREQLKRSLSILFYVKKPSQYCVDKLDTYTPRIEPPRNDKSNYFQFIRGHDIGTNGSLAAAWNVVEKFITSLSSSPTQMVSLFNFVLDKVEIAVLEIPLDVDASSVFEALNARGKPLNSVDLVRNKIYSHFSKPSDKNRLKAVHERLERIKQILRRSPVFDYYRCYFQCKFGFLNKSQFYKQVRTNIEITTKGQDTSDYLFEMVCELGRSDSIELFRSITSARISNELESSISIDKNKRNLRILLQELRTYKVAQPIVFAFLYKIIVEKDKGLKPLYKKTAFRCIGDLTSFVMRTAFIVPKFEPSLFEEFFANMARDLLETDELESFDMNSRLKKRDSLKVFDDSQFINKLKTAQLGTQSSKVRAVKLLFGINNQMYVGSDVVNATKCTLEHILPQSPIHWGSWKEFEGVDPAEYVNRIGNLLIVSKQENRPDAKFNANYCVKKKMFKKSSIQMTREVAHSYLEWSPKVIEKRSEELAKNAASTWKFSSKY